MTADSALEDRAYGALLGLAAGDAIGGAALIHRTTGLGWKRSRLWRQAAELDEQRILRMPQPFTLGRPDPLFFSGTDDTEYAVATARILLDAGEDPSIESLVDGWRTWFVDQADPVWEGIAEASARSNLQKGLMPPATGNDNPLFFDDSAVARCVPVAIRFHASLERVRSVSTRVASITNAEDGIWVARAVAVAVTRLIDGSTLTTAVDAALDEIPSGSWTDRCVKQALVELERADGDAFGAIPGWNDRVVNASYSFGNIAPETFAVAVGILSANPTSMQQALGVAAMLPKQSDSLPGIVGAVLGSHLGATSLPTSWSASVDVLKGHIIPRTAGLSILQTAHDLLAGPLPKS